VIAAKVAQRTVACALLGACFGMPWAYAQSAIAPPNVVAIVGGKLLTITHGTIENGVVLLENGKITAVGPAAATKVPKGAQVYNAKGMTVYPGLFDAETQLGLVEVGSDQDSTDLVEKSDEIFPQMHVVDAFHA
jgi:imidazolonepropionase-like amidohydrolase